MGTILLVLIVCGILYLIHYLKKINYKLDDVVDIDNPYYDSKIGKDKFRPSMPLDKYEKELDKALENTFKEKKYVNQGEITKDTYKVGLNEEVFEENINLPDDVEDYMNNTAEKDYKKYLEDKNK